MRSKLNFLIGVSLKRKVKTKWFLVANILLAILVIGLINIDSIINFFGGDFNDKQQIYVIDNTNEVYDLFVSQVDYAEITFGKTEGQESNYVITKSDKSSEEALSIVEEDSSSWVLVFENDETNTISVKMVSEAYIDTINYQTITSAVNNTKIALAINESGITEEELAAIYAPVTIEREYLDESKKTEDENMEMIMTTVFPIIILPFFMLTVFLVQMIGGEINDEKTTRGMEMIISNVSPKTHFFSKIIAGNLFVLIQGVLLLVYFGLGVLLRGAFTSIVPDAVAGINITDLLSGVLSTGIVDKLIYIIPLTLVLMLITFVAYSLLAGILASMTTTIEDFQQLQTPMMIIMLVGYYLSMMAGMFDGAIFIKVLSFVPLISAILAPSLLVLGQIGIIEFVIAIVLTIGLNWLLIRYGLKIYKVGILNYSSKDLWKKMFRAAKE